MQIYIHRNNEDFGPYSKEAVLEYLKQGVFQAYDYACFQGMSEWKTVSELLGINSGVANAAHAKSGTAKAVAASAVAIPGARTTGSLGGLPKPRMMRRPVVEKKSRTGMIIINLILAALVGAGIYLRMGGGGERGRALMEKVRVMVMGAPASAPDQATAPAPVLAPVAPAPAQTAAAAPTVAPASIPVASVAAPAAPTPAPLPSTVHVTVPVKFPAMMNGQAVGSVSVPQGTEVQLVKADGAELIINYKGGMVRIARNLTDIDSAPSAAPAAPALAAPSSTPAGTPDATDPDAALGAGGN